MGANHGGLLYRKLCSVASDKCHNEPTQLMIAARIPVLSALTDIRPPSAKIRQLTTKLSTSWLLSNYNTIF